MKNPRNPKIYVIDQSKTYRRIIDTCLSALNYTDIRFFGNIQECLTSGGEPEIIILDDNQGKEHLSGIEFMRVYKSHFANAKFIFLSSNTNLDDAVKAIQLGAYDYIVKSKMGMDRLVKRIERMVKSQIRQYKRRQLYRTAVVSLGMFSLLLVVAVLVYTHSG